MYLINIYIYCKVVHSFAETIHSCFVICVVEFMNNMDVNAVAFLLLVLMMHALHLALHVEPKFFLEIVADHFSIGVYLFYWRR